MDADILIIGAGVAGLYAARTLSAAGKKVMILEGRDRPGGRIQTLYDPSFELPVEMGAEFVHGDLKLTLKLLREAGLKHYAISGDIWRWTQGQLEKQEDFIEDQDIAIKKLKELKEDMSVRAFLETYFAEEKYEALRKSLTSFVEGYDAADADHASCFALLQEMVAEEGDHARVKGGYGKLVDYLVNECNKAGCNIQLSTTVSGIKWQRGKATVTTSSNSTYIAEKLIVTVPISVLQSSPGDEGHINIDPLPSETQEAIHALGSTGVIKILLQFKHAFWENTTSENTDRAKKIGFLFADTLVPTWWTQLPEKNGMISGWLAGPAALQLKKTSDENILEEALQSLSNIFSKSIAFVKKELVAHHIMNWTKDPFTRGAYAYEKLESKNAKRILNTPLENTLYFAGEALYEGPQHGTVEGALLSGQYIAEMISAD